MGSDHEDEEVPASEENADAKNAREEKALGIETTLAGGAPIGNKNATKNRPWAEAINRALLSEDGKRLRTLAERLIARAEDGDVTALKEIGDRVDGKVMQSIEHSGPDGGPIETKNKLEIAFIAPGSK